MVEQVKTFKLYVGGLSLSTQNKDLHSLFSKFGKVIEAVVMSGKCFGFVHMEKEKDGMAALKKLDGYMLNGRPIHVEAAINTKRPNAQYRRNIFGKAVNNMDDFDIPAKSSVMQSKYVQKSSSASQSSQSPQSSPASASRPSPSHNPLGSSPTPFQQSHLGPSPPASSYGQAPSSAFSSPKNAVNNQSIEQFTVNNSGSNIDQQAYSQVLLPSSSAGLAQSMAYSVVVSRTAEANYNSGNQSNAVPVEVNSNGIGKITGENSTCFVCGEEYNILHRIPKILSCNHTFCSDCLIALANPADVRCPRGLTTNHKVQMREELSKPISVDKVSDLASIRNVLTPPLSATPPVPCICLSCYRRNTELECKAKGHQIMAEDQALILLREKLRVERENAILQIRETMAMRAQMKERINYTSWAIKKFEEELKRKIDDEDLEEAMLHSYLTELSKYQENSGNNCQALICSIQKIQSLMQNMCDEFKKCEAVRVLNNSLKAVVLKLKPLLVDSCLSEWGFGHDETLHLGETLEEHFQSGNSANILLMYMICDLLKTKMQRQKIPTNILCASMLRMQETNIYGLRNHYELNAINDAISENSVEHVLQTTQAIESGIPVQLDGNLLSDDGGISAANGSVPSMVSSGLSLGLSNLSLLVNDSHGKSIQDEPSSDNKDSEDIKPSSYLDAAKRLPSKQLNSSDVEMQSMISVKTTIPIAHVGKKRPHCWMMIRVNGIDMGRIVLQLRPDMAPKMVENFIGLCTSDSGYGYKDTRFFKSGDGFLAGGDVEFDNGTGGYSIYNRELFEADRCPLKDEVGAIRFKGNGTSEAGRGMIGSQFMIWYAEREFKKFAHSLVFGKVVEGMDFIRKAGAINMNETKVVIGECGLI